MSTRTIRTFPGLAMELITAIKSCPTASRDLPDISWLLISSVSHQEETLIFWFTC